MEKNRWMLVPVLLLAALLVSCGKKDGETQDMGELVRVNGVNSSRYEENALKMLTDVDEIGII